MNIKRLFSWAFWLVGVAALRRLLTNTISGTMAEDDLIPMREAVVELDIGGIGTWVPIESWAIMVEPTRGTVPTSEEKTLDGLNHTGYGLAGNATVKLTIFATNPSAAPLDNLYALTLGAAVDIRWSKSGTATENRYYTDGGRLTECNPPGFDANSNQSSKFTATITAPDILMAAIPTA